MTRIDRAARTRPRHGFTLVEVVMVAVIIAVIGGGLLTTFMTGRTSFLSADASIQVQQEARRALDNIVRELRESGKISCDTSAPPGVCNSLRPQLNFQRVTGYDTTQATVQWGSDTDCGAANPYVHYTMVSLNNINRLVRVCNGSPGGAITLSACNAPTCRVLANYVNPATSGFSATSVDNGNTPEVITVTLEIRYANAALPGGSQSSGSLTSQVRIRNTY